MSAKDDGGPAFPCSNEQFTYGNPQVGDASAGMSLRDWFAGHAMPFCLAEFGGNAEDQRQYAEAAYQIADAMIEARKS